MPAVTVSENDRDDDGFAVLMPLHRARHFDVIAVIGGEKVGADEQEDDLRRVHVFVNLPAPFLTSDDAAVVPLADDTVSSQHGEVRLQLVTQCFVLVGVGVEGFGGGGGLRGQGRVSLLSGARGI